MRYIFTILFVLGSAFAEDFYAVVQPIDVYNIKSATSGTVIKVNKKLEATIVKNKNIVKIDSKIDIIDLQQSKIKLSNLRAILKIEKNTLKSFNKVSSKSKFDKDNQKIKILNISSNINDMVVKVSTLRDKINKKNIVENNVYIYNIAVKKGDWVNPGTLLYTTYDLKKAKVEIFLPINTAHTYKNKTIYIDDKKTNLKINKLYEVADSKHISSYKCEIILPKVELFSKVVKISFK